MFSNRFAKFAWAVLLYNLLVVAWGVFVRVSKSGDGCGSRWPLCDGTHQPLMGDMGRMVELSHRVSTTLCGVLALILLVWAFRRYAPGHLARKASAVAFGLTVFEGLIGAALVKFGLVTTNDSVLRAFVMMLHVNSTFFLVAALTIAWLAASDEREGGIRLDFKGQSAVGWPMTTAFLGLMLLGVTGAISALGHQLRPTQNVIQEAMSPTAFWMVKIQPLHPLLAVSVGLYLILSAGLITHLRPDPRVRLAAAWVVGLYLFQMAVGALNILLKAPVPMQMFHLVMADINFMSLAALSVFAFARGVERVEARPASETPAPLRGRALLGAYVALTKPRVISLLLFTTLTAMVAAQGGWPGSWLFFAVALGGYMSAGAANAINMVIDRDIDGTMRRTASRPTVTQQIPSANVLLFAFVLGAGAFGILWAAANLLAAVMALSGLVYYVIVYTMLLKRRTWQNIVIGGAAGAFPPLVGWAAVSNTLPPLALYLFAIIFVWTPVHFWSLALLLKDEYKAAGVPMLPVVKGDRSTMHQIWGYAFVTVVVTMLPLLLPGVGWIYAVAALALNAVLLLRCFQLHRQIDRPRASSLFHYSMVYLALLFLLLAVDRTVLGVGAVANGASASVRYERHHLLTPSTAAGPAMEAGGDDSLAVAHGGGSGDLRGDPSEVRRSVDGPNL
jgi:heme o synthase